MIKVNLFTKIFMRLAPINFLRYAARQQGVDDKKIIYAFKLFDDTERIDIQPLPSAEGRGFVIYLDCKLSLHFYQDGDRFYYDGLEIGEYKKGDVTVFDHIEE